jgi:uncharacterized protein with FMN-binding domain
MGAVAAALVVAVCLGLSLPAQGTEEPVQTSQTDAQPAPATDSDADAEELSEATAETSAQEDEAEEVPEEIHANQESEDKEEEAPVQDSEPVQEETPVPAEAPAQAVQTEVQPESEPESESEPDPEPKPEPDPEPVRVYQNGTFTGTGQGYDGPITVSVTIQDDVITAITVVSAVDEDPYWSDGTAVIGTILSSQSTGVDTVTGATYSSGGIIDAVKAALESGKNG